MTPARVLVLGLLLTGTAGFIDSIGFIALGGFYTSFMSGNTTQLGGSLATGPAGAVLLPAALVLLFLGGSVLGSLIADASRDWGAAATLAVVVGLLALALGLHFAGLQPSQSLLPLAAAAGTQNAVLQPMGAARLGTTFVTGTLFNAGQDLARASTGKAPPWRWLQHLLVWGALCSGAALGALAYLYWKTDALLGPALVYTGCMVWFLLRRRLA